MKIHTTVGVYPNSEVGNFKSVKINGVKEEHLEQHIQYNKTMRFGRALFVDGKCVYKGSLTNEQMCQWEQELKDFPLMTVCTAPYH